MRTMSPTLQATITKLESEFATIAQSRKSLISPLTAFIEHKQKHSEEILLNFICTHNSRRSHIAQIWAQAAAYRYDIRNVLTFSGGTEATAFNPRAVTAMRTAGFGIATAKSGSNPTYAVTFTDEADSPLLIFSKRYDEAPNPTRDFAAIMVCSDADENCPVITGSAARIALPFDDPKAFDDTEREAEKYLERVHDIGREILFAFSLVSNKK